MMKNSVYALLFDIMAKRNNTTVDDVHCEIESAIRSGFENPYPEFQEQYANMTYVGDVPTPEEVISFFARAATLEGMKEFSSE